MRKLVRGGLGFAAGAVLVPLALPISGFAQNGVGSRVLIGTNMVTATGCHDTSRTFVTSVPNADRLDRSYRGGVLAGIEMVETAANNSHAVRNVAFTNNGTAITYSCTRRGLDIGWSPRRPLA